MRRTTIGAALALLLGIATGPTVAWAAVSGIVNAVKGDAITVSGASYKLEDGTRIEDMNEHEISLPELRPGTPVELEFDEDGRLAVIRATVVR